MGPASIHGTLSLTAQCDNVQCCSHGTFIIVIGNNDLEQKPKLIAYLVQKVYGYQSCCVSHVHGTLTTGPLTKLTTIWLDNAMDGVLLGDVTSCSLSVIAPRHGHLATMA
jgi:hypothetical protein